MITKGKAKALRKAIEDAAVFLPDDKAIEAIELYPLWEIGVGYETGERIRYDEKLYRVVQSHTSQTGWEPPSVPALFTEIAYPGYIPVWKQPTGAQDAYMKGDKVHYPDKDSAVYASTVDYNTWQPGVYGWEISN